MLLVPLLVKSVSSPVHVPLCAVLPVVNVPSAPVLTELMWRDTDGIVTRLCLATGFPLPGGAALGSGVPRSSNSCWALPVTQQEPIRRQEKERGGARAGNGTKWSRSQTKRHLKLFKGSCCGCFSGVRHYRQRTKPKSGGVRAEAWCEGDCVQHTVNTG